MKHVLLLNLKLKHQKEKNEIEFLTVINKIAINNKIKNHPP